MTNPTSNFGWQMPTNTDLVSQLPADFEVFGQAVDTSLADLKGGTTGQILAKNTNADMDFVWTTAAPGDITAVTAGTGISGGGTSGDVTITNAMATTITTKGDLIIGTGVGTFTRQGVGTNNQVLMADSVDADGVKWANEATATLTTTGDVLYASAANTLARRAIGTTGQVLTVSGGLPTWATPATPASGGLTLLATTNLTSGNSINISGLDQDYVDLYIEINGMTNSTGSNYFQMTINNYTGAAYENAYTYNSTNSTLASRSHLVPFSTDGISNLAQSHGAITIHQYAQSSYNKIISWNTSMYNGSGQKGIYGTGTYPQSTAVSSIQIKWSGTDTFATGVALIYGVK